jgi:transcriptional regulator with XRE-family HTH domain
MGIKFIDSETQADFEKISLVRKFQAKKRFAFAEQLRLLLKEKRLTQKAFADLIGKEESEISKWLSGFHNFTKDTESLIEFYLESDISVLVKDIKPEIIYLFALSEQHKSLAIPLKEDEGMSELLLKLTSTSVINSTVSPFITSN